jgi:two-component system, NarL family, nitrate/nitrite response regulator NarL
MRILLVDDHRLVRETLALFLANSDLDAEVREAATLADALQRIADEAAFDLVILDLWLPDAAGLNGVTKVRAAAANAKLILCSGMIDGQTAAAAIEQGADGILLKASSAGAMLRVIETVLNGEKHLPAHLALELTQRHDRAHDLGESHRRALGPLTQREFEILAKVAEGLTNAEVSRVLGISEATVKLHLSQVFDKIGARNRADAVRLFFEKKPSIRSSRGVV